MIVDGFDVSALKLLEETKLLLVRYAHRLNLRGAQVWLLLPRVRLICHHTESHREEEVATAVEGARVALENVEALVVGIVVRLE